MTAKMKSANFFANFTACRGKAAVLLGVLLAGCVPAPTPQVEFSRSEAVAARVKLALAYLEQNEFAKAKQNIDKALAHDSQDYLPHSVLAYYYQQIGEVEKAESSFQTALALGQTGENSEKKPANQAADRPDVRNNYGAFLCRQGKFEQAYAQFEQALQSNAPYYHQADTLENLALCAARQPNALKQAEALSRLRKLDHKRAEQLQNLLKNSPLAGH